MDVLMVYSESGGVTKTTTSVSLAQVVAEQGRRVVLMDLDPRHAATKWVGAKPVEEGLHVGAILASEDPQGWAEELAVAVSQDAGWSPNLRVVPGARNVSNREADRADFAELRLKRSLEGLEADVVVIDCPNRQGGPLILAALNASNIVVYAAMASNEGVDGVEGARTAVRQFLRNREMLGAPAGLVEKGIIVGSVRETVMSRPAKASLEELEATGMMLTPIVPDRVIVGESRIQGEWYGNIYGESQWSIRTSNWRERCLRHDCKEGTGRTSGTVEAAPKAACR